MTLKMTELSPFISKYTDDEIRSVFLNYLSGEALNQNRERLVFRTVIIKEKNTPRSFVEKGVSLFFDKVTEKLAGYYHQNCLEFAMRNHDLNDSFFTEYAEAINWDDISKREDLTLDIFVKYREKIKVGLLRVDFGTKFINDYFEEFGENIVNMKLTAKQIERVILEKRKVPLTKLAKEQKKFNSKIFMDHIDLFGFDRTLSLFRILELDFEQMIKILENFKECDGINDLICEMLGIKELTLEQRKDIKYFANIGN